jgi:hypothetical protein
MKYGYLKLTMITLLMVGLTTGVSQAVERAMLEKSASYALNNSVHAFRVPVADSLNKIKFYDVQIDLLVNPDGTISPSANVVSALSPNVGTINIVPGTYQESNGTDKCKVTNLKLTNGRTTSVFTCNNAATVFEFSVASGLISSGHPFLAPLTTAKVNTRTDAATQNWGMLSTGTFNIGVCVNGETAVKPIGAITNGNQIVLTLLSPSSTVSSCTTTLTKLP